MTMPAESAATVRGRRYPADPEWFCDFRTFLSRDSVQR